MHHKFDIQKKNLKVAWKGTIMGVQPRIRLTRSYDERYHTYLGYVLIINGVVERESREFIVAIGKAAQTKYGFQAGDQVEGMSEPVLDERLEVAKFYKTSNLQILEKHSGKIANPPPWLGVVPDLYTYRQRGHRRLAARTYDLKYHSCIWGCRMPVEMIKVPGRRGMIWEEEDWIDEESTTHRSLDE